MAKQFNASCSHGKDMEDSRGPLSVAAGVAHLCKSDEGQALGNE